MSTKTMTKEETLRFLSEVTKNDPEVVVDWLKNRLNNSITQQDQNQNKEGQRMSSADLEEVYRIVKIFYLDDHMRMLITELSRRLDEDLKIPEIERREIEEIIDAHFVKYADVFKALA